jgi:hypothetical protein
MSADDVEQVLQEIFPLLLTGPRCALREVLQESVRAALVELDALDRGHPVWAYLAVQTVNHSRLSNFLGWQVDHGLAGAGTWWAKFADDLWSGSCVSVEAWARLEELSPRWRYEWAVLQGFYNFHLFSPGRWLGELAGYLERQGLVAPALAYLRRPETVDEPCVRWLAPGVTAEDLLEFAEVIEDLASA